jgi:ketosteroid isomerase-like protein
MSDSALDLVGRAFKAYVGRDWAAFREVYDPDVVMHHLEGWPEPGPSVGREAVVREFQTLRDSVDAITLELTAFDQEGDRVAFRYRWRGTGTGPDLDMEFSCAMELRNGLATRQSFFWDHAEALEAARIVSPS